MCWKEFDFFEQSRCGIITGSPIKFSKTTRPGTAEVSWGGMDDKDLEKFTNTHAAIADSRFGGWTDVDSADWSCYHLCSMGEPHISNTSFHFLLFRCEALKPRRIEALGIHPTISGFEPRVMRGTLVCSPSFLTSRQSPFAMQTWTCQEPLLRRAKHKHWICEVLAHEDYGIVIKECCRRRRQTKCVNKPNAYTLEPSKYWLLL